MSLSFYLWIIWKLNQTCCLKKLNLKQHLGIRWLRGLILELQSRNFPVLSWFNLFKSMLKKLSLRKNCRLWQAPLRLKADCLTELVDFPLKNVKFTGTLSLKMLQNLSNFKPFSNPLVAFSNDASQKENFNWILNFTCSSKKKKSEAPFFTAKQIKFKEEFFFQTNRIHFSPKSPSNWISQEETSDRIPLKLKIVAPPDNFNNSF